MPFTHIKTACFSPEECTCIFLMILTIKIISLKSIVRLVSELETLTFEM